MGMHKHMFFSVGSGAVCRPYVALSHSAKSYAELCFQNNTNSLLLVTTYAIPFLKEFNRRLELQIQKVKAQEASSSSSAYGGDSAGAADANATDDDDLSRELKKDVLASAEDAAWGFGQFAFYNSVSTALTSYLISRGPDAKLSQSIAYAHDLNLRLANRYLSRLLGAVGLPERWARWLYAVPCTEEHVQHFEGSGIPSPVYAFQDSVKRNIVTQTSTCIANFLLLALRLKLGRPMNDDSRPQPKRELIRNLKISGLKLAGGAVGATLLCSFGPAMEFLGEALGQTLLLSYCCASFPQALQYQPGPDADDEDSE